MIFLVYAPNPPILLLRQRSFAHFPVRAQHAAPLRLLAKNLSIHCRQTASMGLCDAGGYYPIMWIRGPGSRLEPGNR